MPCEIYQFFIVRRAVFRVLRERVMKQHKQIEFFVFRVYSSSIIRVLIKMSNSKGDIIEPFYGISLVTFMIVYPSGGGAR